MTLGFLDSKDAKPCEITEQAYQFYKQTDRR